MLEKMIFCFQYGFSSDRLNTYLDETNLAQMFNQTLFTVLGAFIPVALAILTVGVLVNYLQTGGVFTLEPLKMKFDRLNPVAGLKRMFSPQKLVDLFKALFKVIGVFIIIWQTFKSRVFPIAEANVYYPPLEMAGMIWQLMFTIVLRIVLLLLVLAVLDFYYQRYQYRKLRMTKKEVQDERNRPKVIRWYKPDTAKTAAIIDAADDAGSAKRMWLSRTRRALLWRLSMKRKRWRRRRW